MSVFGNEERRDKPIGKAVESEGEGRERPWPAEVRSG